MCRLTACYIDLECAHSYRVWRWLTVMPEVRSTIQVRPFSLETHKAEGRGPWDRTRQSSGLELLALAELAREGGVAAHHAFVDAAFAAVHDEGADATVLETWLELGTSAGLNMDAFTADTERWRAEVGLWHEEARDELGVMGVPTLVFDDRHALFVRLDSDVVDHDAAVGLLEDLAHLSGQPVDEVRRTG